MLIELPPHFYMHTRMRIKYVHILYAVEFSLPSIGNCHVNECIKSMRKIIYGETENRQAINWNV